MRAAFHVHASIVIAVAGLTSFAACRREVPGTATVTGKPDATPSASNNADASAAAARTDGVPPASGAPAVPASPDGTFDAGLAAPASSRPASALYTVDKFDFLTRGDGMEFWEQRGSAWIDARVAAATKKSPELVRVPLMHRGEWGCMCPEYYLGVMSTVNPSNRWIDPVFAATALEPERLVLPRRDLPGTVEVPGLLMIAEGYFTGEVVEKRFGPDKPDKLNRFRILRIRPPRAEFDAKPVVVRPSLPVISGERDGGDAPSGARDKPFFVITESFPIESKDARSKAEALAASLRAKGFADAEALDTTSVPGLFCCYWAVTLGRHASEAEASRAAAAARTGHVIGAVRRGY